MHKSFKNSKDINPKKKKKDATDSFKKERFIKKRGW
jgi:hypothetical protein